MDVAGGNERVDAAAGRWGNGFGAGLDVAAGCTGEAADDRPVAGANAAGDALHRIEIAGTGKGEASFDHVHPEPRQLLGNHQLLLQVEAGPWRLFTIPQGGVEDEHTARVAGTHGGERRGRGGDGSGHGTDGVLYGIIPG